jgi:hypothetical protein
MAKLQPSNVDLLAQNLGKDSLAHKLVSAYHAAEPRTAQAAIRAVLEARLNEIRGKLNASPQNP